jgi:predicted dehydrogenase
MPSDNEPDVDASGRRQMAVAIVGSGLIGGKRAAALGDESRLIAVADVDAGRAERLSRLYPGCVASIDWRAACTRSDVDLVIVATTNDALADATLLAAAAGKHVLVEKPGGRCAAELRPVQAAVERTGVVVKVGFNHRFHPAFQRAHAIFASGEIGPLMYIRARYGHGGRLGYEREWRANPEISGGGELLDQGVHLIDLARWFAGDFADVDGDVATYFWNMPVEDNGFMHLTTRSGQVAWLHASCTEWKNLFSFEIFCRDGKLHIEGLGGSYGVERLSFYRMLPQMGPPETTIYEYPGADTSWRSEYLHLLECIRTGRPLLGTLADAHAALVTVERVYERSHERSRRRAARDTEPVTG